MLVLLCMAIIFCGIWHRRSGWVVAELGKHPGGEDLAKAGLAAVDLSVRVPVGGHHIGQVGWGVAMVLVGSGEVGTPGVGRRHPAEGSGS